MVPRSHPTRTWELEFYLMAKTVMLQISGVWDQWHHVTFLWFVNRICDLKIVEVWYHKSEDVRWGPVNFIHFVEFVYVSESIGDVQKNLPPATSTASFVFVPPWQCFFFGFQGVGSSHTASPWRLVGASFEFSNLRQATSKMAVKPTAPCLVPIFFTKSPLQNHGHVFYFYSLQKWT